MNATEVFNHLSEQADLLHNEVLSSREFVAFSNAYYNLRRNLDGYNLHQRSSIPLCIPKYDGKTVTITVYKNIPTVFAGGSSTVSVDMAALLRDIEKNPLPWFDPDTDGIARGERRLVQTEDMTLTAFFIKYMTDKLSGDYVATYAKSLRAAVGWSNIKYFFTENDDAMFRQGYSSKGPASCMNTDKYQIWGYIGFQPVQWYLHCPNVGLAYVMEDDTVLVRSICVRGKSGQWYYTKIYGDTAIARREFIKNGILSEDQVQPKDNPLKFDEFSIMGIQHTDGNVYCPYPSIDRTNLTHPYINYDRETKTFSFSNTKGLSGTTYQQLSQGFITAALVDKAVCPQCGGANASILCPNGEVLCSEACCKRRGFYRVVNTLGNYIYVDTAAFANSVKCVHTGLVFENIHTAKVRGLRPVLEVTRRGLVLPEQYEECRRMGHAAGGILKVDGLEYSVVITDAKFIANYVTYIKSNPDVYRVIEEAPILSIKIIRDVNRLLRTRTITELVLER